VHGKERKAMTGTLTPEQMGRRNRAKGGRWMIACVKKLRETYYPHADVIPSPHRADIGGVGDVAVESKDTTRWDDILAFVAKVQAEAGARGGLLPVVWKKTRGEGDPMRGLIIMEAGDFWRDRAEHDRLARIVAALELDPQLRAMRQRAEAAS
jgi:hypothetical protein